MASTIASLFGPSAEEIVFARKKEEEDARRQEYLARLQNAGQGLGPFAWAARAGVDIGESLRTAGSMFGEKIEDPLIRKSNRINRILIEENVDLNDPEALKRVARRLEQEGYTNEAVKIYDRASVLSTQQRELSLKELQYGPTTSDSYVDIDGNMVKQDKAGNFFDMQGNPLNPAEVVGRDVFFDTSPFNPQRDAAIARGRAYREGAYRGPADNYVEKRDGDSSEVAPPTSVNIDPDKAKAEADRKIAQSEAEKKQRQADEDPDIVQDPDRMGEEIARVGAIEGGNQPIREGGIDYVTRRDPLPENILNMPDRANYVETGAPPAAGMFSESNYIDPNKFEFVPGGKELNPKFSREGFRQGEFEFRPTLLGTGGLFREDMKNLGNFTPTANTDLRFDRLIGVEPPLLPREEIPLSDPYRPEYDPAALDAVRFGQDGYGTYNPRNLEFGQKSYRYGKRDSKLIDMYRGDFDPTDEDYKEALKELAQLDPDRWGGLYNSIKSGAIEMTKELGESLRRIITSNSPAEYY